LEHLVCLLQSTAGAMGEGFTEKGREEMKRREGKMK